MKSVINRYIRNRIVVIDGHEKILYVVKHRRDDWRHSIYPQLLTVFEAKEAIKSFNRWRGNTGEPGFDFATANIIKVKF